MRLNLSLYFSIGFCYIMLCKGNPTNRRLSTMSCSQDFPVTDEASSAKRPWGWLGGDESNLPGILICFGGNASYYFWNSIRLNAGYNGFWFGIRSDETLSTPLLPSIVIAIPLLVIMWLILMSSFVKVSFPLHWYFIWYPWPDHIDN